MQKWAFSVCSLQNTPKCVSFPARIPLGSSRRSPGSPSRLGKRHPSHNHPTRRLDYSAFGVSIWGKGQYPKNIFSLKLRLRPGATDDVELGGLNILLNFTPLLMALTILGARRTPCLLVGAFELFISKIYPAIIEKNLNS